MGGRHGGRSRVIREDGLMAVRDRLQQYADRGVFRGLAEESVRAGRHRFRFLWLTSTPFTLVYAPATGAFVFPKLLPNVPPRSSVGVAIRRFVVSRNTYDLPEHRRVDPDRATVACYVKHGSLSVRIVAKANQHGYAARRAVNLIHEIFMQLQTYFPEYMWENFDASQD